VPPGQVFQKQVDIFPAGMRDIAIREKWRNQEDIHVRDTLLLIAAIKLPGSRQNRRQR